MANYDFEDLEFLKIIQDKAPMILRQLRTGLMEVPEYKILYSQYLHKFWTERYNKNQFFVIYIKEEDIERLDFEQVSINLKTMITEILKVNNQVLVNNKFNVMNAERVKHSNTNLAYKSYKDLSKEGFCVFFFGKDGVEAFIKGESEDVNIFYCEEDLLRYSEKKDICKIKEVFETYQRRWLSNQCEYSLFFENNSNIAKLDLKNFQGNILRNKPEKLMRDHLRKFLNEHMRHTFLIETELASSKKKLDIYTEVNGEFYFFEIKWLGKSISEQGDKIGTSYTDSRAREGVKQTLEYIEELIQEMNINVKCGYLVVFDARENKVQINYKNYSFIEGQLEKYMMHFDKIDDLKIDNRHPA